MIKCLVALQARVSTDVYKKEVRATTRAFWRKPSHQSAMASYSAPRRAGELMRGIPDANGGVGFLRQ